MASKLNMNDTILQAITIDDTNVLELLNRPVIVDKYDILADEMAALVSRHQTLHLDTEDVNKVVATFKPLNQKIAAT